MGLRQKDKLTESDIKILKDSIQALRQIQVEFVENEASLRRFDIMFKDPVKKQPAKTIQNEKELKSISVEPKTTTDDTVPINTTENPTGDGVVEVKEASEEAAAESQQ